MASSLHYVTPLQLSDTFNEWFLRSNSLIDVVNKINVYNVENGWGLSRYRGIDGTTILRLNIGQAENEYDNTASAADFNYGLRFIADAGSTGAVNPDVSATRKILGIDFENLPQGGGGQAGAKVSNEDFFAFSDTSTGTGAIAKVLSGDMLPYGISGDHRFYGNIFFDGTNTTINSSELNIDDKLINIATSNTGDTTQAYLNDTLLDGSGIIIKGLSGDKRFLFDYYDAGSTAFNSFKPNIDFQIASSAKILSEDKTLDLMSMVDDNFDLSLSQLNSASNFWKIRKNNLADGQGRLIFFHENTATSATQDAISLSKAGTVQLSNIGLHGAHTSGGVAYESSFSYLPKSYGIPTTGMSGDVALHYKWTNRKLVHQTNHGFTCGDLLRYYPYGTTYDRAWNASKETAEVIGIVESDNGGSADSFVAVFNGLVDLTKWNPNYRGTHTAWSLSDGTTMSTGQVYFLDNNGLSGGFTADPPIQTGIIKKPVLLAVGEKEALFVNYLGHEVSTADVASSATGDYIFADSTSGYLVNSAVLPNQGFKNKIINGNFDFWQRAEDGGDSGANVLGAVAWNGTTGARFVSGVGQMIYTADCWALDTRLGTQAAVHKISHPAATDTNTTDSFTTAPLNYVRVLNNMPTGPDKSYFMQRIENVNTLAPKTGTNKVTVTYWSKGISAAGNRGTASLPVHYVTLHQVFDGNSGGTFANSRIPYSIYNATGDYSGGSTFCLGVASGGILQPLGITMSNTTSWVKNTNTFIINSPAGMLKTSDTSTDGVHDSAYNWLELRFELPETYGISGGFELSSVQLEGGDDGTDFEQRPRQVEEQLVNRYFQRHTVGIDTYGVLDNAGGPNSGGTIGVRGQWHTLPYPARHAENKTQLTAPSSANSCVEAFTLNSVNVNNATTGDIKEATPGRGFRAVRHVSTASGLVEAHGTYHFDFSIYDS